MAAAIALALLALLGRATSNPITIPLTPEGEISKAIPDYLNAQRGNAFHLLKNNLSFPSFQETTKIDLRKTPSCDLDLKLEWTLNVESPIYASPVIFPSYAANERKNIFINTFREYVELIEGDGHRPSGWPISYPNAKFYGSPIVYDIDGDGHNDVGGVDYNGNLFFARVGEFGEYLEDYHIQLPKLKIRKDWMNVSAHVDQYMMISMFDRFEDFDGESPPDASIKAKVDPLYPRSEQEKKPKEGVLERLLSGSNVGGNSRYQRRLQESFPLDGASVDVGPTEEEELYVDHGEEGEGIPPEDMFGDGYEDHDPYATLDRTYAYGVGGVARGDNDDGVSYYMHRREMGHAGPDGDKFIQIEPHVLASATMVDIDKDGQQEIIFPVSYFIDSANVGKYPADIDPSMYFASAVACFDLETQGYRWNVHLDLSTNKTGFQAKIYSQPTVVDLDGDNRLEVLVGTALGMVYVLDGDSGYPKHHFPMQTHAIHSSLVAADLLGGAELEILITDLNGNVVVVNVHGEILYDRQLPGSIYYTPTLADVNRDGITDIVLSTYHPDVRKSVLYVLSGDSGRPLHSYLLPAGSIVSAPVVLANLGVAQHMHLLITTYAGHLYLLAPATTCVQVVDMGGPSYTSALLEDVTSDGVLDIVTTSLHGDVSVFSTQQWVDNANVWNSMPRFRHSNGYEHSNLAVEIPFSEKQRLRRMSMRHMAVLKIPYTVTDSACQDAEHCRNDNPNKRYVVTLTKSSNWQSTAVLFQAVHHYPGQYEAEVAFPGPSRHVLLLSVENEHGQYAEDSATINLSSDFLAWIKYFLIMPVVVFCSITYLKFSS